jgi:hypothetical protein
MESALSEVLGGGGVIGTVASLSSPNPDLVPNFANRPESRETHSLMPVDQVTLISVPVGVEALEQVAAKAKEEEVEAAQRRTEQIEKELQMVSNEL